MTGQFPEISGVLDRYVGGSERTSAISGLKHRYFKAFGLNAAKWPRIAWKHPDFTDDRPIT